MQNVIDDSMVFDEYWTLVERFGLWPWSKASLKSFLAWFFQGVTFDGKSMLDIGGGTGWISLFGACMGARLVVCLEPEVDGSRKGALNKLRELCVNLPHHLRIIPKAVRFHMIVAWFGGLVPSRSSTQTSTAGQRRRRAT